MGFRNCFYLGQVRLSTLVNFNALCLNISSIFFIDLCNCNTYFGILNGLYIAHLRNTDSRGSFEAEKFQSASL